MYKKIKNALHVWFIFNLYNLRNLFTKSSSQWLYYNNNDYAEICEGIINKLQLKSNSKILDIGCGNGEMLRCFSNHNKNMELYGTDINALSISLAKKNVPQAIFSIADCSNLNFAKETMDCCIIFGVFNYLRIEQLQVAICEAISVTKTGGSILILNNYERKHHYKKSWGTYYLPDNYWKSFSHENVSHVTYIEMTDFCKNKKYEGNAVKISIK